MPRSLARERFFPIHAVIPAHLAFDDRHGLSISPNPYRIRHSGFLEVLGRFRIGHGLPKDRRRLYNISQSLLAGFNLGILCLGLERVLRHDQRVSAAPACAVIQDRAVVRLRDERGVCPVIVQQPSYAVNASLANAANVL